MNCLHTWHYIAAAGAFIGNEVVEFWMGRRKPMGAGSKLELTIILLGLFGAYIITRGKHGSGSISTEKRD